MDNVVEINEKADDKALEALLSETVDAANDILQQIKQ